MLFFVARAPGRRERNARSPPRRPSPPCRSPPPRPRLRWRIRCRRRRARRTGGVGRHRRRRRRGWGVRRPRHHCIPGRPTAEWPGRFLPCGSGGRVAGLVSYTALCVYRAQVDEGARLGPRPREKERVATLCFFLPLARSSFSRSVAPLSLLAHRHSLTPAASGRKPLHAHPIPGARALTHANGKKPCARPRRRRRQRPLSPAPAARALLCPAPATRAAGCR